MRVHVLGDAFCDVVSHGLTKLPTWGGDAKANGVGLFAGGSALNTAIHVRGILSGSDHSVTLFTALGESRDDWASEVLENHLSKHDVGLKAKRVMGKSTGVCIVLSGTSDRAFVTSNGAVTEYSYEDVDVANLAKCDHLHFGGVYALTGLVNDIPRLISEVRQMNPTITISLDTNFDATGVWGRPWLGTVFPMIDFIKLNDEEAEQVRTNNCSNPSQMKMDVVSWLAQHVRQAAIVTHGKDGAAYAFSNNPTRILRSRSLSVTAIDVVGAGDAFNAGFIASWCTGRDGSEERLKKAVEFACKCGALNVMTIGACQVPVSIPRINDFEQNLTGNGQSASKRLLLSKSE